MQNQTEKHALVQANDPMVNPVEIDASLLEIISGGFPKGTWRAGETPTSAITDSVAEHPFPKGTW